MCLRNSVNQETLHVHLTFIYITIHIRSWLSIKTISFGAQKQQSPSVSDTIHFVSPIMTGKWQKPTNFTFSRIATMGTKMQNNLFIERASICLVCLIVSLLLKTNCKKIIKSKQGNEKPNSSQTSVGYGTGCFDGSSHSNKLLVRPQEGETVS